MLMNDQCRLFPLRLLRFVLSSKISPFLDPKFQTKDHISGFAMTSKRILKELNDLQKDPPTSCSADVPDYETLDILNKNVMVAEDIGDTDKVAIGDFEANLAHEGNSPVQVPDLSSLATVSTKEAMPSEYEKHSATEEARLSVDEKHGSTEETILSVDENNSATDASIGVNEASNDKLSESRPYLKYQKKFSLLVDPLIRVCYPRYCLNYAIVITAMCLNEEANFCPFIGDIVVALEYLASQSENWSPESRSAEASSASRSSSMQPEKGTLRQSNSRRSLTVV